jgi:hypothetical protein
MYKAKNIITALRNAIVDINATVEGKFNDDSLDTTDIRIIYQTAINDIDSYSNLLTTLDISNDSTRVVIKCAKEILRDKFMAKMFGIRSMS